VKSQFRSLDPQKVIDTIAALHGRITRQFPGASLADICADLLVIAKENSARARRISAANVPLRAATFAILAVGVAALAWVAWLVLSMPPEGSFFSALQGVEAAANLIVLVGAPAFFLTRIDERLKRRQALAALHEMRSLVHVIDMHQLARDPAAMIVGTVPEGKPVQANDVARYLDFCSEMLSLSAKVAVLFAQGFPDPEVIETVSDIERLTTELSQKIWQKIMIILTEIQDADGSPAKVSRR
jgi:hypothetical protein